jgi:hypothetical protein
MGSLLKYSRRTRAASDKRYFVIIDEITSALKPNVIACRREYCGTGLNPEFGRVPAPCQWDFCHSWRENLAAEREDFRQTREELRVSDQYDIGTILEWLLFAKKCVDMLSPLSQNRN